MGPEDLAGPRIREAPVDLAVLAGPAVPLQDQTALAAPENRGALAVHLQTHLVAPVVRVYRADLCHPAAQVGQAKPETC